MRRILIACALIAAPAVAQIVGPAPMLVVTLSDGLPVHELCRQAANQAFNGRRWVPWIIAEMERRGYAEQVRDTELVVCQGYIAGANDMAAGRVIPIDTD